jgi:hypothetical protein
MAISSTYNGRTRVRQNLNEAKAEGLKPTHDPLISTLLSKKGVVTDAKFKKK